MDRPSEQANNFDSLSLTVDTYTDVKLKTITIDNSGPKLSMEMEYTVPYSNAGNTPAKNAVMTIAKPNCTYLSYYIKSDGTRILDQDLGELAFSVGYGFDITQMARSSYYSQIDYGLNNYDTNIPGNTNLVSFSLEPNNPWPFKRLAPELNAQFISKKVFVLTWEESFDDDEHDRINYLVVVDRSYKKVNMIKNAAKRYIRNALKDPTWTSQNQKVELKKSCKNQRVTRQVYR